MTEIQTFEPTRSFAYRFVRYTLLPEVQKAAASQGIEPFLLRDFAWPMVDKYVTKEQQAIKVQKAKSEGVDSMASIIRFYVNFLAKELEFFKSEGKGYFRNINESDISEDELAEAAVESGDEEAADLSGWIYAFSFPAIVKQGAAFPIKIGKTVTDVDARVADQVKGSASFEQPVILGRWQAKRVAPTELAIHNLLKARGRWREDAPGREWFDTTLDEIKSVIAFISQ